MDTSIDRDQIVSRNTKHAILRCRSCKAIGRVEFTLITTTRSYLGQMTQDQEVQFAKDAFGSYFRFRSGLIDKLYQHYGRRCPQCGDHNVDVNLVKGVYIANKPCDGRCMSAKRNSCECSCGGANHGAAHGNWA
jgi:Zn finger protein HypA/HybF involved in hydrogenase expression